MSIVRVNDTFQNPQNLPHLSTSTGVTFLDGTWTDSTKMLSRRLSLQSTRQSWWSGSSWRNRWGIWRRKSSPCTQPRTKLVRPVFRYFSWESVSSLLIHILYTQGLSSLALYCDFHAHSRKFNIFMYGCENRRHSDRYLKEQVRSWQKYYKVLRISQFLSRFSR